MAIDLAYAMGLPPLEAINYLRGKVKTVPTWNWYELWQEQHTRAFAVAKAAEVAVLEELRRAVEAALRDGVPFHQFADELEPLLKARGWWGKDDVTGATLGTPHRLAIIYRTNLQNSYMAGRYREFMQNVDRRPYWQYVAVMDSRTRPAHAALHGKVFRYDDPFWNTHYPPIGFQCRCRVRALSEKQVERKGLKVESGAGNMKSKTVEVGGEPVSVTGWRDGRRVHYTDPGWSYNPGTGTWSGLSETDLDDGIREALSPI